MFRLLGESLIFTFSLPLRLINGVKNLYKKKKGNLKRKRSGHQMMHGKAI